MDGCNVAAAIAVLVSCESIVSSRSARHLVHQFGVGCEPTAAKHQHLQLTTSTAQRVVSVLVFSRQLVTDSATESRVVVSWDEIEAVYSIAS